MTWDTTTIQGAIVAVARNKRLTVVAASAPQPWPLVVNERNQRWALLERPNSRTRVWIGSHGGVIWDDRDGK